MAYPEGACCLFFFFNFFPPPKRSKLVPIVFLLPPLLLHTTRSPFLLHSSLSQRLSTTTTTVGDVGNSHGRGQPESNAQMPEELQALSHCLYQSHTARRTASLDLPHSAGPVSSTNDDHFSRPCSRRTSLYPWRSHHGTTTTIPVEAPPQPQLEKKKAPETAGEGKKGIWGWKPMWALSHVGMCRLACLSSFEVIALQGLPASMNGLRLAVCVRKRETRKGTVQTMPTRVGQGMA